MSEQSDDEAPSSVGGDDADAGVPGSPALETARCLPSSPYCSKTGSARQNIYSRGVFALPSFNQSNKAVIGEGIEAVSSFDGQCSKFIFSEGPVTKI